MDNRPIGVCDSGLGGIVVLSELMKMLPNEKFIYLGDTARFPYGNKTEEKLSEYLKEIINFLITKDVKSVIVACGTASTVLPRVLEEKFDVPVIGIIESTAAGVSSDGQTIGVISTERTTRSGAWTKEIKARNADKKVIENSCPVLAPLAEARMDRE